MDACLTATYPSGQSAAAVRARMVMAASAAARIEEDERVTTQPVEDTGARAHAAMIAADAERRAGHLALARSAAVARYAEVVLVPAAAAVWLHDLTLLSQHLLS